MPGKRASEQARREQIVAGALEVASTGGLADVTLRKVAEAAGVSHALVVFHFGDRDALILALLDSLLATSRVLQHEAVAAVSGEAPADALCALIETELARVHADRTWVELFFDYWVLGLRHPEIRRKMRAELRRYRHAVEPLAAALIASDHRRRATMTPTSLAGVIVSFIVGSGVQSVIDRSQFDAQEFSTTARAFIQHAGTE